MKIDKVYEAMFKKIKRGKTPTGLTMHPDTIKVLMDKCGVVETEPFVLQSIRGYPIYENRYMIMNCCKIDFDDGSFGMLNLSTGKFSTDKQIYESAKTIDWDKYES